ncbi:general glycosylation pathway protein, partial [Campylobacter novaezeelandiae]
TIQEVESIDLSVFMQRISSNEIIFLLSFIGFILFIKQHKSVILALPMLLLGFLALKGGLRFTIYAVPIMALGFGFLCIKFLEYLEKIKIQDIKDIRFFGSLLIIIFLFIVLFIFFYLIQKNFDSYDFLGYFAFLLILFFFIFMALKFLYKKNLKLMRVFLIIAILMISLSSALRHIYNYKAPTVFTQNEAILLTKLKELASREDYVVTWWDYGYPIRYYSDVKTLVDGGKHLGKDNFFPSFVLSKDQRSAANMARLSVEYTEKSFYKPYNDLLDAMMRDYNQSNVDLFLNSLSKENFKINTPKTRDIYLYLPSRMVSIFSTVASFSFVDLETGELNKPFTFSTSYILGENN